MTAEPKRLLVPAELYDEALAFCNARRAEKNLEPITELSYGFRETTKSCPCANSVPGLYVGDDQWWFEGEERHDVGHPTRFVKFFDQYTSYGVRTLPVRDESASSELKESTNG